jgi:hypothetical protein
MKRNFIPTKKKNNQNYKNDDGFPKMKLVKTKDQHKRKPKHQNKNWDSDF